MRYVALDSCKEGMIVGKNVYGQNAMLLLRFGTTMRQYHIDQLIRMGYPGVYIDDDMSHGIDIDLTVSELTRNNACKAVQELFTSKLNGGALGNERVVKEIEDVLVEIVAQIVSNKDAVANLAALKVFDNYTYQHCVDVGVLSVILGREFNMTKSMLVELGKAAFFHDIGKMFIPKNILTKPAPLTADEFDEIKKHPKLGYDCIVNNLGLSRLVAEGALYHHERYEGNGYPSGISGEDIPIFSRIIAAADAYDAITTKRAYRNAMVANEAYEYVMGNSGTQFCPKVVEVFVRKVPPFTVGTGVILSDQRLAVVVENRPNFMMRPMVKLIKETAEDPDTYIDLATDVDSFSITIVSVM